MLTPTDADADADLDADVTTHGCGRGRRSDLPQDDSCRKKGASWLAPVDLDGDGFKEYLLTSMTEGLGYSSTTGPGGAYVVTG